MVTTYLTGFGGTYRVGAKSYVAVVLREGVEVYDFCVNRGLSWESEASSAYRVFSASLVYSRLCRLRDRVDVVLCHVSKQIDGAG